MNPTTPPTSALSPATHLGTCTLVGAGPGDPELLTIKALKAIQAATVLLVDDLVSDAIVAHASPTARIVYVGKRGGCTSTPQAFIEKLMLMAVSEGENVVRLKGGDPFIFGRGGEEVEHLRAAGVAVTVINGITAGLAGLTSLGAPLTHREHAHGVVFVTGHAKPGDAGTNWRQLAATAREARLTLVIYMGVSGAAHIGQELLTGLPAHTPVAIIQHASLPHQRHAITTLGQLHATIEREGLASPSVIVVGDVVRGVASVSHPAPGQASATRRTGCKPAAQGDRRACPPARRAQGASARRCGGWRQAGLLEARGQLLAQRFAQQCGVPAAAFVGRRRRQGRHLHRLARLVHRHHREKAAVHMPHHLRADVFGHHLDAHLHRRRARVVDAGQKSHQLAHMNGLQKHHLIHAEGDHVTGRISAGAGIGHLVEQLENRPAMHIAREVGHVRRHQHGHAELV